jgi:hypothetical protein
MSDSYFDDRLKSHRLFVEARLQSNGYFEKLALLNGATVSLVITAALGKFTVVPKHRYTLGVALTFLVIAMLLFLYRNHVAIQVEIHNARSVIHQPQELPRSIMRRIWFAERAGVILSGIGVVLLLVEVWFVIAS